jgi:hypothetical protein
MEILGYLAAILFGLAFGAIFGRLLNAIVVNWESAASAVKSSISVATFMLGGAGGVLIFRFLVGPHQPTLYLLGLAIGALYGYFGRVPARYTLETVLNVVRMNEVLRGQISDPEERALLILAAFSSARSIERDLGLDDKEWAQRLGKATDKAIDPPAPGSSLSDLPVEE